MKCSKHFAPFKFGLEIWCEARSHLAPIVRPQIRTHHITKCIRLERARARFPIFCSVVEEPFSSVNRVDWNRPQPGAPSASPTADPVPSRMAAEKALARAFASSLDARRWRGGAAHAVYGAYSKFRGRHLPRKPAQKVSRFDLGPAEANWVLLACRSDLHV